MRVLLFVRLQFAGLPVFPKYYHALKRKELYGRAVAVSFATIFLFYALVGVGGYAFYGEHVRASFTENLGRDWAGVDVPGEHWYRDVASVAMTFNKLTSAPLCIMALVDAFGRMLPARWTGADGGSRRGVRMLVTCALTFVQTAAAVALRRDFASFTNLVGSFATSTASIFLPIAFFISICGTHALAWWERGWLGIVLAAGIAAFLVGTTASVCGMVGETHGLCVVAAGWTS